MKSAALLVSVFAVVHCAPSKLSFETHTGDVINLAATGTDALELTCSSSTSNLCDVAEIPAMKADITALQNAVTAMNATMTSHISAIAATPATPPSFGGPYNDWSYQADLPGFGPGTKNSYCAREPRAGYTDSNYAKHNVNQFGYLNELIPTNSEFRFEFQYKQEAAGTQGAAGGGVVFGFAFADTIGEFMEDPSTSATPDFRSTLLSQVAVSTHRSVHAGVGGINKEPMFFESPVGQSAYPGEPVATYLPGGLINSGDVLGIRRQLLETTGECVVYILKNGDVVHTSNSHNWGLPDGGCGSGYIWVGHYGVMGGEYTPRVCLANVELATTQCVATRDQDCANP
jgi:hypothetical protein